MLTYLDVRVAIHIRHKEINVAHKRILVIIVRVHNVRKTLILNNKINFNFY